MSSYQFKLFGLIPFGIHTIKVIRFGLEEGIFTKESNQHVPVWKTVFVYLWAVCFDSHRQKKWIKMLKR